MAGRPGIQGRKIIPMNEKIAKGTFRKSRDYDKMAPDAAPSFAIPPSWLNPRAKQIFRHMVKRLKIIGKGSSTHTETIAELACQMEERQRIDVYLNSKDVDGFPIGLTYTTINKFGEKVQHARPEVRIRAESAKRVHMLLQDLCLTPSTIHRAGAVKKDTKKNDFSGF